MNLSVNKEDLKLIGHTIFEKNGNTAIVCDISTSNIEEIFLRNILKCFGNEFVIKETSDYNDGDILYITNLPFEKYSLL